MKASSDRIDRAAMYLWVKMNAYGTGRDISKSKDIKTRWDMVKSDSSCLIFFEMAKAICEDDYPSTFQSQKQPLTLEVA